MAQTLETPAVREMPDDYPGFVTPEKVLAAVKQILEVAKPLRVVAFGSRARGEHNRDSDLDLGVMVEDCDPKTGRIPVRREDLDVWMPIDLLVYSRARHEFMKDSIISVHNYIANEGVTLYDAGVGSIDHRAVERVGR